MITYSSPTYRIAAIKDIEPIAALHAYSWQHTYRGMWPDDYLDNLCYQERLDTWTKRLTTPLQDQYVLLAEIKDVILGFACCYFNDSATEGTLLDNLHVHRDYQGHGIGRMLMMKTAQEALSVAGGDVGYYLWVLSANVKTIRFYEHLGGAASSSQIHHGPAGIDAMATKVIWSKVSTLIDRCEA